MSNLQMWSVVVLSGLATFLWRFLGVVFARRIDSAGAVFQWVTCVSYAMVAGLVFRMIVLPSNDLAEVPMWARLLAVAIAFATYFATRRRLLPGVVAGSGSLAVLAWVLV